MDRQNGSFYEYIVFPGRDDTPVYYAASDDQAFEDILVDYDKSDLACESVLGEAGKRFGVDVQPLTRMASLGLALFAFEHFPEGPLSRITEDGLVDHFCKTIKQYEDNVADSRDFIYRPMRLNVSGTIDFTTDIYLHKGVHEGEFISIMMENTDSAVHMKAMTSASLAAYDRLSVTRYLKPAFILDALHRSHRLSCIPVPSRTIAGTVEPVQDMQLAVIFCTLFAVAQMQERGDIGKSEFSFKDYRVVCEVGVNLE